MGFSGVCRKKKSRASRACAGGVRAARAKRAGGSGYRLVRGTILVVVACKIGKHCGRKGTAATTQGRGRRAAAAAAAAAAAEAAAAAAVAAAGLHSSM